MSGFFPVPFDGLPTRESLLKLYKHLSKHYDHNSHVSPTYYENTDYKAVIDYAERFSRKHDCYGLWGNNCKTFGKNAATACDEGKSCEQGSFNGEDSMDCVDIIALG